MTKKRVRLPKLPEEILKQMVTDMSGKWTANQAVEHAHKLGYGLNGTRWREAGALPMPKFKATKENRAKVKARREAEMAHTNAAKSHHRRRVQPVDSHEQGLQALLSRFFRKLQEEHGVSECHFLHGEVTIVRPLTFRVEDHG